MADLYRYAVLLLLRMAFAVIDVWIELHPMTTAILFLKYALDRLDAGSQPLMLRAFLTLLMRSGSGLSLRLGLRFAFRLGFCRIIRRSFFFLVWLAADFCGLACSVSGAKDSFILPII